MLPAIITIIHYSLLSQHLPASSLLNSTMQTRRIMYNCLPYFSPLPTHPPLPSSGNSFVSGFSPETQGQIFLMLKSVQQSSPRAEAGPKPSVRCLNCWSLPNVFHLTGEEMGLRRESDPCRLLGQQEAEWRFRLRSV